MAAVDVVQSFLAAVPDLEARRLAHAEWGLTVPAERLGGQSLDVGLTVAGGLLRAKAPVVASAAGLDETALDRLLGLVAEAALAVRRHAAAAAEAT